ncbi:MAG TPA: leucine-rich repeat domain-containing protein [Mucilaginibacter sp.]
MNDRYNLNQFHGNYWGDGFPHVTFEYLRDNFLEVASLDAISIALAYPERASQKTKNEIENIWFDNLPRLHRIKKLTVHHRLKQDFFDLVCQIPNLEQLFFFGSSVEDISNIKKLTNLQRLNLHSFTRLTDISPLSNLKNLKILSIENSFKVENYEIIGELTGLVGLELCGDTFAPKNLMLKSLKPYVNLKQLRHLDISTASIIDKSYECILQMPSLERLDLLARMPGSLRETIKSTHKTLKAGFFVDYDFDNKKFYDGKNWDLEFIQ